MPAVGNIPPPPIPPPALPLPPNPAVSHGPTIAARVSTGMLWLPRWVWSGVREGLVETEHLSPGLRRLVWLGYGAILLALATLLLVDTFRDAPWMPTFYADTNQGERVTFAVPAAFAGFMALSLGWAFLLTGVSDLGRRVFVPTALVYGLVLAVPAQAHVRDLGLPGAVLPAVGWALVAPGIAAYLLTHQSRRWSEHPGLELAGWAALPWLWVLLLAIVPFRGGRPVSVSLLAEMLQTLNASGPALIAAAAALTLLLAPEPVNLVVGLGRLTADGLRRGLGTRRFRYVGLGVMLIPVASVGVLIAGLLLEAASLMARGRPLGPYSQVSAWIMMLLVAAPPVALAVWAIHRWRTGRWTESTAAFSVAALVAGLGVVGLFIVAGNSGQDLLGFALGAPDLIPPLLLFAMLTVYGVMGFGARFANRDGDRAPRITRTLLYFGVVLLTLSAVLYQTNVRHSVRGLNQGFQTAMDMAFLLGFLNLMVPYFLWILFRRRHWLSGESAPDPGRTRLRAPRRLLFGLSLIDVGVFVTLTTLMVLLVMVIVSYG